MPIYEYKCASCGHAFEKMVKLSAPIPACPQCGAQEEVRKLVSASSFVLKGGGWYRDHYGLKKSSSTSDAGSSSSSSDSGSSSSSSSGSSE
jgi:putative FmdB family regulatory protein